MLIVGSGPAGLSAGIYTGRAGLDTLIVNDGDPILRRNAHLENHPGFPAGDEESHGLQFWINLPQTLKDSEPEFQDAPS